MRDAERAARRTTKTDKSDKSSTTTAKPTAESANAVVEYDYEYFFATLEEF